MTEAKDLGNFDLSMTYRGEIRVMPTKIKDLRIKAGWTVFELATNAQVSIATVNRLERDKNSVSPLVANKVLKALSKELGQRIDLEDIENDD